MDELNEIKASDLNVEQKESIKLVRNAKKEYQFEFRIIRKENETIDDWIERVKEVKNKILLLC